MQQFKALPPRSRILEVFDFNPLTGFFYRRSSKYCPWLNGQRSGSVGPKGYRLLHLDGTYYMEHRLAWVVHYGTIPHGLTIDHTNGNTGDNRISNLRLASDSENSYHRKRRSDNRTGHKGVYQRENGKYRACITVKKQKVNLGTFDTSEEAYAAYCEAARRLHGDFARLE
jgi:hypothetical protein